MSFARIGYGIVEPNQLSAQKTGQIYASLPLDTEVDVLQNGEFMFYDYVNGCVDNGKEAKAATADTPEVFETGGEPMLVFNEIKLYGVQFGEQIRDFALFRVNSVNANGDVVKGQNFVTSSREANIISGSDTAASTVVLSDAGRMEGMAPRLFKTNLGDIMTTNMVDEESDYALGDLLGLKKTDRNTLVLCPKADAETSIDMEWQVVKVYTVPDGQPGLKLQRVK